MKGAPMELTHDKTVWQNVMERQDSPDQRQGASRSKTARSALF